MRKLMVSICSGAFLLYACIASGADYWPLHNGPVYHYQSENGNEIVANYFDGSRQVVFPPPFYGYHNDWCTEDSQGDIVMNRYGYIGFGMPDPDEWTFDPPVKFLDLPLEVGKSWSTETVALGYGPETMVFSYEVLSQETVTVPYGTFLVYVVAETSPIRNGTWYLSRYYGPIMIGGYKLASINGTVASEDLSWGSVKALFR